MLKTNFKKLLTACCLLLTAHLALAQTGNPFWSLPPNALTFSTTTPSTLTLPTNTYSIGGVNTAYTGGTMYGWGSSSVDYGPSNMYNDGSGNLLFSVVSGYVFNKNGFLIDTLVSDTITLSNIPGPNMPNQQIILSGYAETCVVPNPANCQQYYIFTALPAGLNANGFTGPQYYLNNCQSPQQHSFVAPYVACIDVSQKGPYMPLGEVGINLKTKMGAVGKASAGDLYSITSTPNDAGGCKPAKCDIHYAATKVYNKGGSTPYRLLFVMNNAQILTYKVTGTTVGSNSTGIQWVKTYSLDSLTSHSLGNVYSFYNITELEFYQDSINKKIKVAFSAPTQGGFSANNNPLVLIDFDTLGVCKAGTTHTLYTNSINSQALYCKGIEFSPDGNYVFVAHNYTTNYPSTVDRITYSTSATSYTLSTNTSFQDSQIEKGKDGNLYLVGTTTATPSMAKISSPNSATPIFTTNILSLSGYNKQAIGNYGDATYTLPDQIDQEIYSDFYNHPNLSCCLISNPYDKLIYYGGTTTTTWTTTATTQTWTPNTTTTTANNPLALQTNLTSTITIGEELRIPAGYTVTITGMTLKFSPQARLIIENGYSSKNGGKLILDGCTLTVDTRCLNDMWPGIQVWGNPGSAQTAANQGWLYTKNNTVIQNAYVGVYAGYDSKWLSTLTPAPPLVATTNFTAVDSGQGGAIIQCESTTFLNNQRHTVFLDYSQTGSSLKHFNLCNFTVNAALLASGIKPKAFVSFYNYNPGTYVFGLNGCAFLSSYSTYNYTLTGLWSSNSAYWVDWYNSGSSYTRSKFDNFLYGIYSKNTSGNSATIQANHSTLTSNKVGIYLGNITNATVANDTTKIFASSTGGNCSGLYLDNCTGYKVENNNYTKASGSTANNKYGILVYNSGAFINCIYNNTFDNIYKGSQAQYLNYVNTYTTTPVNGHGGLVYLCNTFKSGTISGADIYVPATNAGTNVGATPTCSTCIAGINYSQGTGQANGYPTTGGNHFSHTGGTAWDFYIDSTSLAYLSTYYYYCPSGYCFSSSLAPAKHKNLTPAPVSDSLDCSSDPYSNGLRISNPFTKMLNGAATYKLIYDSLNSIINSLPAGSPKSFDLTVKCGNAFTARHRLIDEAIHYLINDGSDSSMLKMRVLMREKALELPARSALEIALTINDSALAASALATVAAKEGQSNYVKIHTLLLQNLSKTPEQIMKDPAIVSQLQEMIKDSSDHTAYLKAHILLSAVGLSNYKLYYQEDIAAAQGSRIANNGSAEQGAEIVSSSLYNAPNPFKESTVVKAFVADKTQNAFVIISDMLGREVSRYNLQQGDNSITLQAAELPQSILFCTLVVDGVKIKTNKMVLIK